MTRAPSATVNEHRHWRISAASRIDVEHLIGRGAVSHALGGTEVLANEFADADPPLVHLIAIWRVDRLVVGVVELFLIHVEPDEGALWARSSLRGGTGRNRRGGGRTYNGPPAHQFSFAAIAVHQSSGESRFPERTQTK